MGSMTKVMQKIRDGLAKAEEAPPDGAAGAETPPTAVTSDQSPSASGDSTPETPAPETGPSGFVADETPAEAALGDAETSPEGAPADSSATLFSAETKAWDPARVDPVVLAFHERYSAICEQYRSVRARLLTMNATRVPQVITITSAIPEEGKSVSTLNLGLVMAEGGEHRILIADADFRHSSLASMLGVSEAPGLAEVLHGDISLAEATQPTPLPNLKFLPAGQTRDAAYGEILGGTMAAAAIEEMRATFDYTFMDTPPITAVSDVCLLAPQCDGAIVVIHMRRTPEPTVQQAIRTLQANNVKVLGSLLSRFRERGSGYYDHYYSSYYYR